MGSTEEAETTAEPTRDSIEIAMHMRAPRGRVIRPCKKDGFAVWEFKKWDDLEKTFEKNRRLRTMRLPHGAKLHLTADYSECPGVVKLGYTNPKPLVVVRLTKNSYHASRWVKCNEGLLSFEEARLVDGCDFPTPAEISERAAEIRERHERDRVIRRDDVPGVDGPGIRVCLSP